MAWNTQLPQPFENDLQEGRYTLCRFVRCEASVAAPIVPANILGVQEVQISPVSWGREDEIYQQGAGDESLTSRKDPSIEGQITFLSAEGFNQMAAFLGQTWTAAGDAAIPFFQESDLPDVILEFVNRENDNVTHLANVVFPDAILMGFGWTNPLNEEPWTVNYKSRREPYVLANGTESIYDQFTGDGSTVAFTLSSTPVNLVTASGKRYWSYDDMAYVKEKASADSTGTLQKTGYSQAAGTLTASTAPAASTVVQVLYAKAQA